MDFINANELKNSTRERAFEDLVKRTKERILEANNEGLNEIVLNGIFYDSESKQYFDFEFELKKLLVEHGFRIKPTGYVGGVWQKSEDICW